MSKDSKRLRDKAAGELRASRNSGIMPIKSEHAKRAASFKALADNEEWLEGEKSRSQARPPRRA
jgi:hypothetical protein